jgi:hypothetical protein
MHDPHYSTRSESLFPKFPKETSQSFLYDINVTADPTLALSEPYGVWFDLSHAYPQDYLVTTTAPPLTVAKGFTVTEVLASTRPLCMDHITTC